MLLELLKRHPPENLDACANLLMDRMSHAVSKTYGPKEDSYRKKLTRFHATIVLPRVLLIIKNIATYPNGALFALKLSMLTKLQDLHGTTIVTYGEFHQSANCDIDCVLLEAIRSLRKESMIHHATRLR